MFDVEQEVQEFQRIRGDSLAPLTKKMRDQIMIQFSFFCQNEYL